MYINLPSAVYYNVLNMIKLTLFVCRRWFHGKISREAAETLLNPREDGLFLVRESTNFPGDYTLCVCFQGKVEHYRVKYKDNQLTIDDEEFFQTLAQLVEVTMINLFASFIPLISSVKGNVKQVND